MATKKDKEDREGRKLKRATLKKIEDKETKWSILREGLETEDGDFISREYLEDNALSDKIPEKFRPKKKKK